MFSSQKDSGHGSGQRSGSGGGSKDGRKGDKRPYSDSETDHLHTPNKRGKKNSTSPTLNTIISFKNSLLQFMGLCLAYSSKMNPNKQILNNLSHTVDLAIQTLEPSIKDIQSKLGELHELMGNEFPKEENTPYAKDATTPQAPTSDIDGVRTNFMWMCTCISTTVSDTIISLGKNRVLKLLSLDRNLTQAIQLLRRTKNVITATTPQTPIAAAPAESHLSSDDSVDGRNCVSLFSILEKPLY